MKKMIILYKPPADFDAFAAYYRDVHMPLVREIPGLASVEVTRINKTVMGEQSYALIAELSFDSEENFRAAMKSPENAATGADLANFAEGLATVMFGESFDLKSIN